MSSSSERDDRYREFESQWMAELKPEGMIEGEWARGYIHATWLKRRVGEALALLPSPAQASDEDARTIDRLLRLQEGYEKRAIRALKELRKMQATRAKKKKTPVSMPIPVSPSKMIH